MSNKKKWIIIAAASAGAVALAVWGIGSFISSRLNPASGTYESAVVSRDVIETTVVGTGTLAYGDAETVSLPDGVDVTSVFGANGERVTEGDLLAAVDADNLGLLMSETYAQIAEVDAQLKETPSEPEKVVVTSPVSGRVQAVNAANGASVLETVSEHGSLVLISTDGRMQVDVKTDTLPAVGSKVELALPDGNTKTATVSNVRDGSFQAALTDPALEEGVAVRVAAPDGTELGSGQLESVDAVSVIGPAGTIEGVAVSAGAEVKAGADLLAVRSASPPAAYLELDRQRRELTKRYDALADLYEHGGLTAPVSGVITSCSVDEGTAGSASESSMRDAIGSLPAGVLSAFGMGRRTRGEVTDMLGLQQGGENMMLDAEVSDAEPEVPPTEEPEEPSGGPPEEPSSAPQPTAPGSSAPAFCPIPRISLPLVPPIAGLPLQHSIDLLPLCTGEVAWDPGDEQAQFSTAYTATGTLKTLDGFRFSDDCTVSVLAGDVTATSVSDDGSTLSFTATYGKTLDGISGNIDWDSIRDLLGLESIDLGTLRDLISSGILSSDSLGFDISGLMNGLDFSGLSGFDASALAGLDPNALAGLDASALSGLSGLDANALAGASPQQTQAAETPAFTIAGDDAMQLLIQINQMDVLSVEPGMRCTVTVDALEGEEFEGTVASIADADTSGSGTYTATITLNKSEQMRSGMSASAIIVTSRTQDVMTLPAAAVQEDGSRIFVYTSYDAGSDTLSGEREITTGVSDGASVEVLSGLEPGETVYYTRASALERMMESMGGPRSRGGEEDDQVQITVEQNGADE